CSARATACLVSSGGTWKTPKPSCGIWRSSPRSSSGVEVVVWWMLMSIDFPSKGQAKIAPGYAPGMILAIDQGTTGTTCLVFDLQAELIGRAYREFTQHFPRPGYVEHDASEIWEVSHAVAGE